MRRESESQEQSRLSSHAHLKQIEESEVMFLYLLTHECFTSWVLLSFPLARSERDLFQVILSVLVFVHADGFRLSFFCVVLFRPGLPCRHQLFQVWNRRKLGHKWPPLLLWRSLFLFLRKAFVSFLISVLYSFCSPLTWLFPCNFTAFLVDVFDNRGK